MYRKKLCCLFRIFKHRNGFTLTELVVTLSILGIMTAISIPSYISWLPKHRLQASAKQIYDDLNLAKIRAVKDNTYARITFNTVNETYSVFLDDNNNGIQDDGASSIIRNNAAIESGVDITAANTCGFNNRGMSTTGVSQVTMTNPTGINMQINVNTAGNISIVTL